MSYDIWKDNKARHISTVLAVPHWMMCLNFESCCKSMTVNDITKNYAMETTLREVSVSK